jgi:DNA (cytosine-5)-methyltransferase 1
MKYGSCFSGIEAASVAWHPLGWEGQWFSEIEPFPSAVLAHRFPNVPNLGDITNIHNDERFEKSTIDLLVGGSPCQSFSVAGLRKGLSDPRGNLMLTFLSVAERKKPRWIVWENVPGVLSSNGGRDFASFLTALAELGYGFSYRVLDAQYFGVAQRRRRVFVVGYLGDWRPTAAVLFESHSLQGNPKPSRKKREEATAGSERGVGKKMYSGNVESQITSTLETTCNDYSRADGFTTILEPIVIDRAAFNQGVNAQYESRIEQAETMSSLVAKGPHAIGIEIGPSGAKFTEINPTLDSRAKDGPIRNQLAGAVLAHAFKVRGGSSVETGEQGGKPGRVAGKGYLGQDECVFTIQATQDQMIAQPIALAENTIGRKPENGGNGDGFTEGGPMYTLNTTGVHGIAQPLPFNTTQITSPYNGNNPKYGDPCHTLASTDHPPAIAHSMAIRRLTPTECERLQGFPDSWTQIPYRNKPADLCPDGPRYKACGNSMAVPVMRWIGERINLVENLLNQNK